MKKPQQKHVSMDIKVGNEKNEQDQITQKWEKKNQAGLRFLHGNIPPWKREQCQRKPPGKEISLQFYIWQNCSSGKTKQTKNCSSGKTKQTNKKRQITLNTRNSRNTVPLKNLLEDTLWRALDLKLFSGHIT